MIGNETQLIDKLLNFGAAGLILLLFWLLVNKWATLFLQASKDQTMAMVSQATAMTSQATAMTDLALAMRAAQTDQHEVLLAVRVQSRQIEDLKRVVVEAIGDRVKAAGA